MMKEGETDLLLTLRERPEAEDDGGLLRQGGRATETADRQVSQVLSGEPPGSELLLHLRVAITRGDYLRRDDILQTNH